MSRLEVIDLLRGQKVDALQFQYNNLFAPPIRTLFSIEDLQQLYKIATSAKYSGLIDEKIKLIDEIMKRRGFYRAHAGTNRLVYFFYEDTRFVAKVAIDAVGIKDNPAEFKNQEYFKPFCDRIFEVDPTGVLGIIERVNPITSIEEFLSVKDDIFNLITTKIIGKYVLDDIGASKYMNYGNRTGFGPVLIDFPYAYELDGNKLVCNNQIDTVYGKVPCGGDIDYNASFDSILCTKCGKRYKARELAIKEQNQEVKKIMYYNDRGRKKTIWKPTIETEDGQVIMQGNTTVKTILTREEMHAKNVARYKEEGRTKLPRMKNTQIIQSALNSLTGTYDPNDPLAKHPGLYKKPLTHNPEVSGDVPLRRVDGGPKKPLPQPHTLESVTDPIDKEAEEESFNIASILSDALKESEKPVEDEVSEDTTTEEVEEDDATTEEVEEDNTSTDDDVAEVSVNGRPLSEILARFENGEFDQVDEETTASEDEEESEYSEYESLYPDMSKY